MLAIGVLAAAAALVLGLRFQSASQETRRTHANAVFAQSSRAQITIPTLADTPKDGPISRRHLLRH
jgi:hypothetical protein